MRSTTRLQESRTRRSRSICSLALNLLMDRWASRVIAFLYRITSHRDTAADLAQETFVKLYQARNRYRASGNFSTYLFAIAANLARNNHRWQARHPTISLDRSPANNSRSAVELVDPHADPRESAQKSEQMNAVAAAFQALPSDLREARSLFIDQDMSYAEIAAIAGCSPKAVETRIYRARQILKELLKDSSY